MQKVTIDIRTWSYATVSLLLLVFAGLLSAAEHSPTLDNRIAITPKGEVISVILFLDQRLTMDEVYPVASSLPMKERRDYVIEVLKRQFDEMSPRVIERLVLAQKEGPVTRLRPLWIINAVRVSLDTELIEEIDANYPEVLYIANDAVYENVLDWGVEEIGAPQVWSDFGADGSGVVVGHKDAGVDWDHPGFIGHIWINPGEDLNHNGNIDGDEINGIDDDGNGYVDDFRGWNFDSDNNTVTDDPTGGGHGTKTASVISANSTPCGTVSVAPGAKLMILRGFWTHGALFESSQYAILMGANVVSASVSYKQTDCSDIRTCPNYVAFRWVSEMELAAGIIHANSTGNAGLGNPVPLSMCAPGNCPPPAMTPSHEQQGGVSSIVAVAGYFQNGSYYTGSGHGPSAWSRDDICGDPRMPFCGPEGSPSEYPEPFEDYPYHGGEFPGLAKPDIAAPTSVPSLSYGGGCASIGGTSGATPHVGGTLALIYSAFPGITPEDAYWVLVNGAEDAGDAGFDSLWGFGKLRAFRSCSLYVNTRATVSGHVDDPLDNPVTGARITTDNTQSVFTDQAGNYVLSVEPGTHLLLFEKWGYADTSASVIIAAGESAVVNGFMMPASPTSLQGYVVHDGQPLAGQPVSVPIADLTTYTDVGGFYTFADLFLGTHQFVVGILPWETDTLEIPLEPDVMQIDFNLERSPRALVTGPDNYGYYIYDRYDAEAVTYDWIELNPEEGGIGEALNLAGNNSVVRTLPFTANFYGLPYTSITIAANGLVLFGSTSSSEWGPYPIPRSEAPNGFLAPYFLDWAPQNGGGVYYYPDTVNHRVIVEWWNVPDYFNYIRTTFQAVIQEPGYPLTPTGDSQILFQYGMKDGNFDGLIGFENQTGTDGIQYQFVAAYDLHAVPVDSASVLLITTDGTLDAADQPGVTMPKEFSLEPNYPNPFNPSTTFVWNVPRTAKVRLALYDVLGRGSAVVFDGMAEVGRHETGFDASALATGVYFARLESAGRALDVRKILLLK